MKKNIIFFICFLLLINCGYSNTAKNDSIENKSEDKVYLIDVNDCLRNVITKKVSEITDDLRYIELKTPVSLPIGVVTNIKISDEYIFIIANKGIAFQFSLQGDFIRQIGNKGQGPGEYTIVMDIFINENKKVIELLSADKLLSYSYDGKYIEQKTVGHFSDMMPKDSLLYASNTPFGKEEYLMVVLNSSSDTIGGIPNYNFFDTKGMTIIITLRFRKSFYKYGDDIYFKGYNDYDTIWRVAGTSYTTHAIINMGKYKHPVDRTAEDLQNIVPKFSRKEGDYYLVLYAMEDDTFIYVSLEPYWNPEMGSPCLLFDKHNNTGFVAKASTADYGFVDDIHGGPAFWPQIIYDNKYVSVTNADMFIEKCQSLSAHSPQLSNFLKSINEESNPIITIATEK